MKYCPDSRRAIDLMLMLGLNEIIHQLCICIMELRKEDGHILRRALHLEVEGQRKKGRLKRAWKKQNEEESVKVGLRKENKSHRSKWIVGVIRLPRR